MVLKQHKSHIPQLLAHAIHEFTFERKMSSFPVVDYEVDFIQFNIHSN